MEIDLSAPKVLRLMTRLSQTIDSDQDEDKMCKNYPYDKFSSFKDCDEDKVYKDWKQHFSFLSFVAAKNLNEVTSTPRKMTV